MIGYVIGLGNIWRFPYLAYKNGGGAFLIPYFLMLLLCGIPLFFMEAAIGQFCSQGLIKAWSAVPILQGLSVSMLTVMGLVSIYYNVIIAYSLYFLFASFQFPLPWSGCFSWADSKCSVTPVVFCNISGALVANWTQENGTCPSSNTVAVPFQSPSEQYWDKVALQRSSGLDETGPVVWHLALCLLLSSMLVAAALIKGIKSSGKVVYFTATFPFLVILILLIRGVTLEGAGDGIKFFIGSKSNLTKLMEGEVWKDAACQTFFSISIAMGGVSTLASYSNFHNNLILDTVLVTLINHGSCVITGIAVFSILGHMAHISGKPVEAVVKEGFGLAFIAYPDALTQLPISTLWSVLFFFMLFIIGLDSLFAATEVIVTGLCDAFPEVFKTKRPLLTLTACLITFLLGLPLVTRAGVYWVTLLDLFLGGWLLLFIALMEIIGFIYIYGGSRFIEDIEMMIGKKSVYFWLGCKVSWYFVSPCIVLVILVWSLVSVAPPSYGNVQYPAWGTSLGWCTTVFVILWIPAVAVYKLLRANGSLWTRVKLLCSPAEEWHPYLDIHRGERYSEERCRQRIALSSNYKQM
ncbi:sodium- and chloride-dependent neutral and basic amino acid transporter B(0+)-like [Brachionichthys hirsutus]|uniref:sodium- and chloride-dependent neutral and basic amino acid transporter B(0+)-like n=1 Tax=Brachionichthys hirsutus TaxID=412623 RepID=UPI0036048412